jgi:uncharacterized protein (TIGR02453 family)
MAFRGFRSEALDFYDGLEADNSREYWLRNKPVFDEHIKGAMASMLDDLSEFGPFHAFRPNRDVRFSTDKSPYKTHHGAVAETDGGSVRYTHLSGGGVLAAAGMHMLATDQLVRFRAAVAHDVYGPELVAILDAARGAKVHVSPGAFEPLKTAPRGYPKDHPRIELLRWKGATVSKEWTDTKSVCSPKIVQLVAKLWCDAVPLLEWLDQHVGPSEINPIDR